MISLYIFINRVIDLLMAPLEGLPPVGPLIFWSAVVGVMAMVIYKYTSKQSGIRDAKERIKGHFYEVWLYIDDAPVIAKAQTRILYNAARYMAFALVPLAIMIALFFPLFANFETRYAMRPVRTGEEVLVRVRLSGHPEESWQDKVSLKLPQGVQMVGHPVRFVRKIKESPDSFREKRRDYEVNYKLKAVEKGEHRLEFQAFGDFFSLSFYAGTEYGKRVPPFATNDLGLALIYPPSEVLPADKVERVEIKYPEAEFPFFGWDTWWVWPFLIVSVVVAMLVKGPLKVEI